MAEQGALRIRWVRVLAGIHAPGLSPHHYTALAGFQQLHNLAHGAHLVGVIEQVQERADMHDVDTGHQGQWRVIGIIKHIGRRQEHCAQGVAVAEKVVAEIDELGMDVGAE